MKQGVHIQHYHPDNGRFADKSFLNGPKDQHQTITQCGVNTNGRAEKSVRDIQENAGNSYTPYKNFQMPSHLTCDHVYYDRQIQLGTTPQPPTSIWVSSICIRQ